MAISCHGRAALKASRQLQPHLPPSPRRIGDGNPRPMAYHALKNRPKRRPGLQALSGSESPRAARPGGSQAGHAWGPQGPYADNTRSRHLGESSWRSAAVQGLSFNFLPCKTPCHDRDCEFIRGHRPCIRRDGGSRLGRDDLPEKHTHPLDMYYVCHCFRAA